MVKVTIAQSGEMTKEVELSNRPTPTVKCALQKAGIRIPSAKEIRVNNETADLETELNDGDVVVVTSKVNGGSSR